LNIYDGAHFTRRLVGIHRSICRCNRVLQTHAQGNQKYVHYEMAQQSNGCGIFWA